MSESSNSSKSWGGTIIAGIIILVLVVVMVVVIYYIFIQPTSVPFPPSSFNYGDTIQICPAVFTQNTFNIKNPPQNQYLTQTICADNGCTNCYQPDEDRRGGIPQPKICTITFTGNKSDTATKWKLNQFYNSADANNPKSDYNAKQSLSKFGNRFYMQNATASNLDDIPKLVTYMSFNGFYTWGSGITFPLTGNDYIPSFDEQRFDTPFVVYFLPTSQPDLYYILFPGTDYADTIGSNPNTLQPNDGIMSLRPFAQPNGSNYNPWTNGIPNANGLLTNELKDVSPDSTAIATNIPELFLFKITKA